MENKDQYRLAKDQKSEIAHNLIDILRNNSVMRKQTQGFISKWILTDGRGKVKAFFDVWDIVLKNYLPTTRPVLFRACDRIGRDGEIASFTGRLECAKRFSNGKGSLIICDTKETLAFEEAFYNTGEYTHTFYPLVDVLHKAKETGGSGFSEWILNNYLGEDEYIMRINLGRMHSVKWINHSP